MFICPFCGVENTNDRAKFCNGCGASKDSIPADMDLPDQLSRYSAFVEEVFFSNAIDELEEIVNSSRERLRISFAAHTKIVEGLIKIKAKVAHLFQFKLEFDQNVQDAYAGQDTYLKFRFTNLSSDQFFKVNLVWDDFETSGESN